MSDTGILLTGAAILFSIVCGVTLLMNWVVHTSCMAQWDSKFQPTYGIFEGCRIVVNGERIPVKNYRVL